MCFSYDWAIESGQGVISVRAVKRQASERRMLRYERPFLQCVGKLGWERFWHPRREPLNAFRDGKLPCPVIVPIITISGLASLFSVNWIW